MDAVSRATLAGMPLDEAPRTRDLPALAGVVAALAVAAGFNLWFGQLSGILEGRTSLLAVLGGWWLAFVVSAVLLLRARPTAAAAVVLAVGTLLLHAVPLLQGPQLSDDLYRYAWDGRVQAAGIDPYRYPPNDPRLAGLRDDWLWPSPEVCAEIRRAPGCTRLNRPGVRTIYPPVAQGWFRLLHAVSPEGSRELPLQVAAASVSVGLAALLALLLRGCGRDPRLAVLYAWSPLAVVETAYDGHVDVLAAAFAVGALGLVARRRLSTAAAVLGGLLLGAAVAVKLLPALVSPALVRRRPLAVGTAAVGLVALCYLPHVAAVGPQVLGYLPEYLEEEEYATGSRFLLVAATGLPGDATRLVVLAGLACVVLRMSLGLWRDQLTPARAALGVVGAAFLLATPVQPWYALLLVAVAVLDAAWEWLAVAAAAYPLYFAAVLDADRQLVGTVSYGLGAATVAVVWLVRRHTSAASRDEALRTRADR